MNSIIRSCSRLVAPGFLMIGMAIVGMSITAGKFLVGTIPIMLANGIRFLLASMILLVIVRATEHGLPRLPARLHALLAFQALTGVVAFNILLLLGLDMTTATMSGIITALIPAVIAVLSWATGDRPGRLAWLGVCVAFGGVVVVNFLAAPSDHAARRPLLGALLVFLAVVGESTYTVIGRQTAQKVTPFAMALFITMYATIMFLPLAIRDALHFDPRPVPISTWLAIIFLAVMVSVVGYYLQFRGLSVIPASTAGAFTGMVPIMAVLSAAVLLGEHVGLAHAAGIACVLCGIFLVANTRTIPSPCP